MAITRTEDWSLNSPSSEPSGDIDLGSGASRLLLCFYLRERGSDFTVYEFEVGNQTFDWSAEHTLDSSPDLIIKSFGWFEDSIQAMDSNTISYSDSVAVGSKNSWGFATYSNVQQVTPTINSSSSSSTTSLNIDSSSTSDDMLVAAAIDSSANREPISFDSLTSRVDYDDSDMSTAIADGAGGDNTTTISNDGVSASQLAGMVVILKGFADSSETATHRGIYRGVARGIA